LIAIVGLCVAAAGGYLEFGDRAGAAPPAVAERARPARTPSTTVKPRSTDGTTKSPVGNGTTKVSTKGLPQRILLPQLSVSAPVVSISASRGSLTPPSDPQMVGWWSGGAQPGAKRGSAVITGHTVHSGGGAFDNLGQLQKGDSVVVATARGSLRYRVTGITTYRKQALATHAEQVFDQSVSGRLVLITCEDWNGKVYLSNVVVMAVPAA
jgi:LPXTG-site transpeptidase (sortase) family protein